MYPVLEAPSSGLPEQVAPAWAPEVVLTSFLPAAVSTAQGQAGMGFPTMRVTGRPLSLYTLPSAHWPGSPPSLGLKTNQQLSSRG